MMWRPVVVLLAMWCIVASAPAVIAQHVLHTSTDAIGWVAGLWIVGYIASLLLFVMVGRRSPVGTGVGRMLAALAPWLADWTALISPWCVLPFAAALVGYSYWLSKAVYQVDVLRRDGIWGRGVVLEVIRPTLTVVMKNDRTRRSVRVRVEGVDGIAPYEARFDATFTVGAIPEIGDTVAVLINPARVDHIELIDGEPVIRSAANVVDLNPHDAEQLHRLTTMRDRGDLTDSEYAAAKKRLLDT